MSGLSILALSVMLLIAWGCTGKTETLSFRRLYAADKPDSIGSLLGPGLALPPQLVVAYTPGDWEELRRQTPFAASLPANTEDRSKERFGPVHFDEEFVLRVSRGGVDTAGKVRIMQIQRSGARLSVYVVFQDRVLDTPCVAPQNPCQFTGSPYDLVAVQRPSGVVRPIILKLYATFLQIRSDTGEVLYLSPYELISLTGVPPSR